ncbi:hypothetical protein HQ305_19795 [Rhodococcus sp. BP-149]|uniref:hypothetical protein n=1 Tax=unclassified Rhodococcus (in: high G+C Gram-positive bacteria) TaxID=192944 RepID=UPI001C9A4665|nr:MULTISPECIES: hypothetical protein [unclassified Rhodococcus (in: high G+C Gram-positive bacteria)]MBY6687480.1 hypothetical protein [Rhodococcus sp. BP-288]MBY6696425.1 hypothetical protein [Rhodococcus sp. BP-188]MBY6700557.1 hypothetical protein [Rhodococcus sp. BP-285]MBY6704420.1 hypothetical protein [Rhodococcus sp. BP-283]MBY6713682.1 hypothetical protein [Rhodococcus sp. BP-160]
MAGRFHNLDQRTRSALGGPGLAVCAVAVVAVLIATLIVQKSEPSTYVVVAVLFVVALTINLTARSRRARKARFGG